MKKQTRRDRRKQKEQEIRSKPPIEFKICPNCKVEKPMTQFGRHKEYGKERVNSWCKGCARERSRLKRQEEGYREKHATYMREYRKKSKHT